MNKIPSVDEKLERRRLAAEEGAKALKEVAERSIAVRKNMVRLRALRLAREAETARTKKNSPQASSRKRGFSS